MKLGSQRCEGGSNIVYAKLIDGESRLVFG